MNLALSWIEDMEYRERGNECFFEAPWLIFLFFPVPV